MAAAAEALYSTVNDSIDGNRDRTEGKANGK